jgi:hypothetical protein
MRHKFMMAEFALVHGCGVLELMFGLGVNLSDKAG